MEPLKLASDKILSGKGATPESDYLTPLRQHGNENDKIDNTLGALAIDEFDPGVRRSALKRTPVKQAVDRWEHHLSAESDNHDTEKSGGNNVSPDMAFLRSLVGAPTAPTELTEMHTPEMDDGILVTDTPGSRSENSPGESFQVKKKRKRNNALSPEEDKLMHEIQPSANITLLNKQVLELIEFGSKNQNVHKQVKALARKLRETAEKVALDYKRAEFTKKEKERDIHRREKLLQDKMEELEDLRKTNVGKNHSEVESVCQICKNQITDVSNLNNVEPSELKSFRHLVNRPWHKDTFRHTKLVARSSIGKIPNHVIILSDRLFDSKEESHTNVTNKIEKEVLSQFPELENEIPSECLGGYNISLEEVTTSRIKGTNKNTERTRSVSVMLRHDSKGDNLEKAHGQLLEVKKTLLETGMNEITLIAPTYIEMNALQKTCECVLKDTNVNMQIVTEKATPGSYAKATRAKVRKDRGEALIVEANEGKGYDTLLSELRKKLDPDAAVNISGVKKTINGNLLLSIRGDSEASKLKEAVSEILDTSKVRVADGLTRRTVFVKGIDSMASDEEIKRALLSVCKLEHQEQFRMAVNKNMRGEQTAVVTMTSTDAEKLVNLRTIRIGFSDCYVQERVKVDRCYKCWQFGHSARSCGNQDTDMSNCCYKCGQPGHHKARCTSKIEFCPTCKTEGHQAGTGGCRFFRTALSKELKRRKASTVDPPRNKNDYN